ncbi:uncharacterized protein ACB058_003354 isoform 1-T1 [Synchiropus picturatus]
MATLWQWQPLRSNQSRDPQGPSPQTSPLRHVCRGVGGIQLGVTDTCEAPKKNRSWSMLKDHHWGEEGGGATHSQFESKINSCEWVLSAAWGAPGRPPARLRRWAGPASVDCL